MIKAIKNVNLGILCLLLLVVICLSNSCSQKTLVIGNPPAEGFDVDGSDRAAIAIADEAMEAMGGRAAYDNTRYLSWNFFGSRKHVWDKLTGDIYIKNLKANYELYMNIHDMDGQLLMEGQEITHADSLSKYLQKGKEMWINDAYWLVMPYKLKDSGVTLKHLGEGETTEGAAADKLELTFKSVGVTPNNKYIVYVDKNTKLVTQWDFYTNATDEEARFSTPWQGYKDYGEIKLCGDRGRGQLTEISVSESLKYYFK